MREIIETDSHLVVSALAGDAAAGGVPFALAADHVVAREDVVLNPYYRHMGGLYGSEYWTYLLPRRVGPRRPPTGSTSAPFTPVGTREAVEIGLLDAAFGATADGFGAGSARSPSASRATRASASCSRTSGARARATSRSSRCAPTATRRSRAPTAASSAPDRSYHEARHRFVHKLGAPCAVPTPAVEDRPAAIGSARAG